MTPFTLEELALLWDAWNTWAPAEAKVARDAGILRGEAWALTPYPPVFHPDHQGGAIWRSPDTGYLRYQIGEWPPALPGHLQDRKIVVTSGVYISVAASEIPDPDMGYLAPPIPWAAFVERAAWVPRVQGSRITVARDAAHLAHLTQNQRHTQRLAEGCLLVTLEWCSYEVLRPLTEERIQRHLPRALNVCPSTSGTSGPSGTRRFIPPTGYRTWEAAILGRKDEFPFSLPKERWPR